MTRKVPSSSDVDGGDGGGGRGGGETYATKLEHWPRLSTQRLHRRAHLFQGHSGPVTALAYVSSSSRATAAAADEIATSPSSSPSSSRRPTPPTPASKFIISASSDGTVKVWDVDTGRAVHGFGGMIYDDDDDDVDVGDGAVSSQPSHGA